MHYNHYHRATAHLQLNIFFFGGVVLFVPRIFISKYTVYYSN